MSEEEPKFTTCEDCGKHAPVLSWIHDEALDGSKVLSGLKYSCTCGTYKIKWMNISTKSDPLGHIFF